MTTRTNVAAHDWHSPSNDGEGITRDVRFPSTLRLYYYIGRAA